MKLINYLKLPEIKYSFLFYFLIVSLFFPDFSFAADDINAVFADINQKTSSITTLIINGIVYTLCVLGAIATGMGIYFKKLSWVDAITAFIIVIVIGFIPTIVRALINH